MYAGTRVRCFGCGHLFHTGDMGIVYAGAFVVCDGFIVRAIPLPAQSATAQEVTHPHGLRLDIRPRHADTLSRQSPGRREKAGR